jgi:genome maintenance exonuclease 1
MFNYCTPKELKDLKSETFPDGKRYYTLDDGTKLPSVTTVLGAQKKDAIMAWRKRVGEETANKISAKASGRGTRLHNVVEKYLLNEMSDMKMGSIMPDAKELFVSLRPILDEHVGDIYGIEQSLYSDRLKIAGRCDCIGEWDGELSIIDWKTASKQKEKRYIQNYFMQAAAYAEMFEERTGKRIDNLVIVIANDDLSPQIFVEKRQDYLNELNRYINDYHLTK